VLVDLSLSEVNDLKRIVGREVESLKNHLEHEGHEGAFEHFLADFGREIQLKRKLNIMFDEIMKVEFSSDEHE
jgi:hypothetical protein